MDAVDSESKRIFQWNVEILSNDAIIIEIDVRVNGVWAFTIKETPEGRFRIRAELMEQR